ncbi:metalloendopeptidase CpaA [Lysobacter antibioticus]|uniref:metalloendopeptidase CpaA n=1 Tax=Lysobacter antibioticus TaxID=84531 RepID=UPI001377A357|nr:metalloendopeptidase CpaA [Lysobacter antibioticus]
MTIVLTLVSLKAMAIDLSPNQIGGGNIPGTYPTIDFHLRNGDWAPRLTLSNAAGDQYKVSIHSVAAYDSQLVTTNTDYPLSSMRVRAGDNLTFVYQAARQQWSFDGPTLSPNTNGGSGTISSFPAGNFLRFKLANGDWAQTVTLPATAPDGSLIVISSTASVASRISPQNIKYSSTFNVRTGDQYAFTYRANLQRWISIKTPIVTLNAATAGPQMQAPIVPNTQVKFSDGSSIQEIRLPASAGDRDRVTISSDASGIATISNANVDTTSTLKIFNGSRYEFTYIRERTRWAVQSSPTLTFTANSIGNPQLPDMKSPTARYTSSNGNWMPLVHLPIGALPGDRVIVKSDAASDFTVTGLNTTFGATLVRRGESIRFIRNATGAWSLDTRLITMLLIYSEEAAAHLGETAAQMRLLDGLRLTNEALENSKANFYVKAVGLLKRQFVANTLGDVLSIALKDPVVISTRSQLAADAVYYEGTEEGCGLAWLTAGKNYMIGTGSLACGTNVMRHEFGHNMGLNHGDSPVGGSAPYAKGYSLIRDVMGGNAIPYYSNPNLYTATSDVALDMPMGIANVTDSVRAMNERSKLVSEYF